MKCPFCSEEIKQTALKCRYCGEWLNKPTEIFNKDKINKRVRKYINKYPSLILWFIFIVIILNYFFINTILAYGFKTSVPELIKKTLGFKTEKEQLTNIPDFEVKIKGLDENLLFNIINDYETEKGYKPYIEDSELCEYTQEKLDQVISDGADEAAKNLSHLSYSSLALNIAQDYQTEQVIFDAWLTGSTTAQNFKTPYKYGCIKCDKYTCIFLLGNKINGKNAQTTIYTDPIINCKIHEKCGGNILVKKSLCDKSYCCFFKSGPVLLYDKSKCVESNTQRNSQYSTSAPFPTYAQTTYVPCTLYYSYLNKSETYNNLYKTKEECDAKQAEINKNSAPIQNSTPIPVQTTNDPSCSEAVAKWNEYRENFIANEAKNYSSSFEAMVALENERQYMQNLINSYGCSITLR